MWNRNPWVVGVVSSLVATVVASATSAVLHTRFSADLVLGVITVSVIAGLAVFSALLVRQKNQIGRELDRLEVASWPDWMREIGLAARQAGIKVFRVGGSIIFEKADGEQHLLAAEPAGEGVGRVLARECALEVLQGWGLQVSQNRRASASLARSGRSLSRAQQRPPRAAARAPLSQETPGPLQTAAPTETPASWETGV
jgi:hypothetical protein